MHIAIYITMLVLLWIIRDSPIFRSMYNRRHRQSPPPELQDHRHRLALFLLCVLALEIAVMISSG